MANKNKIPVSIKDQKLEMAMRDALDGMLEISLQVGLKPSIADFEILDISAAEVTPELPDTEERAGEILDFPPQHLASA